MPVTVTASSVQHFTPAQPSCHFRGSVPASGPTQALRIFALEGQVGFWVLATANQSLPATGLSRVTLLYPGTLCHRKSEVPSLRCSYGFVILATPACIFGDYPYSANVYELSTSVTSQQGIFWDARAPNPGTVFDHCFVECELWLVRASIAMCAGCLATHSISLLSPTKIRRRTPLEGLCFFGSGRYFPSKVNIDPRPLNLSVKKPLY